MRSIKLLDCTLRDGGYINDWLFGQSTIICIFERLVNANVDIIEVGFLDDRRKFDINRTIQPNTACFDRVFRGCNKKQSQVFAMIDYGTCDINNISECKDSFIDGIRVIFKKPNMKGAVEFSKLLMEKGYKVSLQLVSVTSYSDRDILDLIDLINQINPYAVSMVDTYGLMHREEMLHYFDLLDYNLNQDIVIGYHSHNNFQLGSANEIEMLKRITTRGLLVDGTAYGMGKSAGNAPLELLAMHLNENYNGNYDIDQILEIIDSNIMKIYREHYWGYSLLYFLAASNDCHPKYIEYLLSKKTLSVKAINTIVKNIDTNLRLNYDEELIEQLYINYQKRITYKNGSIKKLEKSLKGKEILLIAPGKSIVNEESKIKEYIYINKPVVISANCIPEKYKLDYVFISNSKRYSMLFINYKEIQNTCKIIATSNVLSVDKPFDIVVSYDALRDDNNYIGDNSVIMLIKLMMTIGVEKISLAGFDGFSANMTENYYNEYMEYAADIERLLMVNDAIKNKIKVLTSQIELNFITESLYRS